MLSEAAATRRTSRAATARLRCACVGPSMAHEFEGGMLLCVWPHKRIPRIVHLSLPCQLNHELRMVRGSLMQRSGSTSVSTR